MAVKTAPIDPALCVHIWRIDPPNGPTSRGVCRKCRCSRDFRNSSDVAGTFDTDKGKRRQITIGRRRKKTTNAIV